ncbi:conserved protein of unknown function (plasmid) [Rhodovastum atsumiense]|uniref:Uncharacterized protein n=1 Tax=Rhodovastum atsumiense TaxID=504468 RepID=A0A5M6IWU7_9PROT|nr:hypothetical protein [Rhodovastum atsumiense]KAA5611845.1 hypothetical protein F1189_12475 [Rhodovastum atsumiense]CAH2606184.1 conserved protein of unknown function [Rhodovastum atsumiense]
MTDEDAPAIVVVLTPRPGAVGRAQRLLSGLHDGASAEAVAAALAEAVRQSCRWRVHLLDDGEEEGGSGAPAASDAGPPAVLARRPRLFGLPQPA